LNELTRYSYYFNLVIELGSCNIAFLLCCFCHY